MKSTAKLITRKQLQWYLLTVLFQIHPSKCLVVVVIKLSQSSMLRTEKY